MIIKIIRQNLFCRWGWHWTNLDVTYDRSKGYKMLLCETCQTMRKIMNKQVKPRSVW